MNGGMKMNHNGGTTRRRGLLVAALVATAFAGTAPAAGGADSIKAKLKITKLSASGASGTLSSKKAKCEKRRKVTLRFVGEYGDVKIGNDKTNSKGFWKIKKTITDRGIFYATTPKKGKCAKATSKDKRL